MKKEQNLNNAETRALNIPVVSGSLPSLQTTLEMFYDFLYERDIAKQIGVGIDTVVKHFIDEKLSGNANRKIMWEYKREQTTKDSYTPEQFFQLLNNYANEGWELVYYNETVNERDNYSFTVVLKKQRAE